MGRRPTNISQPSESSKGNHFKPGQHRPTRHMASRDSIIPLAIWRAAPSKTHSPYGELGRPRPARHMASWADHDPLAIWQAETKNLIYMIEELTTKVNQGVRREEVLKLEVDDMHLQSAIENLVRVECLRQLKSEAVCIATEKNILEEELGSQCYQLQHETKNLVYMIGELTTKADQGVNREEALKVEVDHLHMQSAI
ncbi:hypothetical protein F2Q69_00047916 [Brassica cretica]|uniref:Uncharacterized protein n=1 Tax=Brassica cretica TaxID=69181 RepID=A0A8S9PNG3_BRACR|nr:hypothetical protein F2Q69_00047916 [Brassica cretica]